MKKLWKIIILLGLTGLISLSIGLLANYQALEKWHLKLTNRLYTRNDPGKDIVMVYINNKSLTDQSTFGQKKIWPRAYYTQTIKNLRNKGAKVIGVDIMFTNKTSGIDEEDLKKLFQEKNKNILTELQLYLKGGHPDDLNLASEIKENKYLILPKFILTSEKTVDSTDGMILYEKERTALPLLEESTKYNAFINSFPDSDKIIRRVPIGFKNIKTGHLTESFSLQIARQYLQTKKGKKLLLGDDYPFDDERLIPNKNGEFFINYAAPPYSFKYLSFVDVYKNQFNEADVKNKIVLIGASDKSLQDIWPTPNSKDAFMPGVEIQANAIQTILDKKFLREQSISSQIVSIIGLTAVSVVALNFFNIILSIIYVLLIVSGYTFLTRFSFAHGLILNMVYPYLTILFSYICMLIYRYFTEIRAKRELKFAFSHYVNPTVVNEIVKHPERLKLGGEKREITVFFSDIAHFTSLSEKMTPETTITFLNEYLDAMTQVIMKYGGTLDKYEGDAIVAFFGAPLPQADHAVRACLATLEARQVLKVLHQKWQKEGKPLIDFRVGLNTGEAIIGNVGSTQHFDYTMIGDTVNLGSRLEGANKFYGTHIMMSETTAAAVKDWFILRKLDLLRVVGKQKPVAVFELLSEKRTVTATGKQFIETYNEAMAAYEKRDFASAEKFFSEALKIIPDDPVSKLYTERCQQFIKTPPPAEWDFVVELKGK